ncbi:MAG TPA: Gldg family protein, partial [Verrucomicrobiota bacterium]|nr:Gldg family protein [Verrucomicrobiota bacterium]
MTPANVHSPLTRSQSSGNARIAILVCLVFLLGMGLGAWWIKRSPRQQPETEAGLLLSLSSRSRDVLKNLDSPVEIRFYSLLNDSNVRESSGAFAADVGQLLAEYQQHGGGKIKVTTIRSESQSVMKAASADGISPFNLEKG